MLQEKENHNCDQHRQGVSCEDGGGGDADVVIITKLERALFPREPWNRDDISSSNIDDDGRGRAMLATHGNTLNYVWKLQRF